MQNPEIVRKRLGDRVRFLREQKGWSQDQMSRESGLGRTFVGEIERGEKDVRMQTVCKIAATFHMTMSQLFEGTDDLSASGEGGKKRVRGGRRAPG